MRRNLAEEVRRALPRPAGSILVAVLAQAEHWGLGVHLVGGPVRDHLLGRALRDVDLIVEPQEERGALELAREAVPPGIRVVSHGRFGTVRLEGEGSVVDLATVRSERYAHPGALPDVAPGTLEEDLRRRDFTVNALAIPLTAAARRGREPVIDPDQGLRDLAERVLRAFHPRSFHDDPTRALRAARLAPRLGFSMARSTRSALRSALRDGAFGGVSGERFLAEIERLFADAPQGLDPALALRLLDEWHVLGALEPGLALESGSVAPLRRLGRMVADPPWPPSAPRGVTRAWVAGLMLWLAPLQPALRRRALRRLAVRGQVAQKIGAFPRARDAWLRALARSRGRGSADAALRSADEDELLALAAAAAASARRRIVRYAREDRGVRLPISGDDLLEIGLRGPAVGRALARIRVAYLDRRVRDREEAISLARELARGGRRRPAAKPRRRSRPGTS